MTVINRPARERFSRLSIGGKLLAGSITIGVTLILVIGGIGYFGARSALQDEAFARLENARTTRKNHLLRWFEERHSNAEILSRNPIVIQALEDFTVSVEIEREGETQAEKLAAIAGRYAGQPDLIDTDDGTVYSSIHTQYHPLFLHYLTRYDYHDIFLISNEGVVVYSAAKESDFAVNLLSEPFQETGLAAMYSALLTLEEDATVLNDFAYYAPSDAPAAFIGSPVYDDGEQVGMLVFQISVHMLNEIMNEATGLGESGEAYLVGADFLFRSDSRFINEFGTAATILNEDFRVDTPASRAALSGQTGSGSIANFRGVPVLSAWMPVVLQEPQENAGTGGITWALIAEIDSAEALSAANRLGLIYLLVAVLALALLVVVSFIFSRQFSWPIIRLTEVAEQIAAGDLSQRVTISTGDEIEVLAGTFNDMTQTLEELVKQEAAAREWLQQTVELYVRFVENVAQGELSERLEIDAAAQQDDPLVKLGLNLNKMAGSLQMLTTQIESAAQNERDVRDDLQDMIARYIDFVESVADGDLTRRLNLDNRDASDHLKALMTLGDNLDEMVSGLAEITNQSRETSLEIVSATAQILSSTTQQLASATEQDSTISQTSATASQVQSTMSETADRAARVSQAAQRSLEASRKGQEVVRDSIRGMDMIRQRVQSIAETILALSERTQQIGSITDSVNDIAEQSKVLALNASIEAARAGEEGKSFAVVAMEVRNLAEQSREATEQIREILGEIQSATNAAVMTTEEGIKGVDEGRALIDLAGRVIHELAATIQEAAQAAAQIAASTNQQSIGMDQLATAMDAIRQASLQVTASVQQTERSAQDLNSMAARMQEAVERYRL